MKNTEKLIWKLIDRQISEDEFQDLQKFLMEDRELRRYYQSCLESNAVLSSHLSPIPDEIAFPETPKTNATRKAMPFLLSGWVAALLLLIFYLFPANEPQVHLATAKNVDWRGVEPVAGEPVPLRTLHLKKGTITLNFPTETVATIHGPAFFQVIDHKNLEVFDGEVTINHQGKPGDFSLLTPVGELRDLGTRFQAYVHNLKEHTRVIAKVTEGKVQFSDIKNRNEKIFSAGETATITDNGPVESVAIHLEVTSQREDAAYPEGNSHRNLSLSNQDSQPYNAGELKAIDLMLAGNLKAQMNYSIIESIAQSIDEKTKILQRAELSFRPVGKVEFAEAAMPEIEAMAHSIVEGCVDFSKISLWAASKTAEIAWIENKNDQGEIISRIPYANRLDQPSEGNRLLFNLEKIRHWLQSVHQLHQEKGMGWVSSFGCPEDGKLIFENRNKKLFAIERAIASIKSNLE